jgi:peptidyl-prolyl cis-trans isomerase C
MSTQTMPRSIPFAGTLAACAIFMALSCAPAALAQGDRTPDKAVAKVDGITITEGDIAVALDDIGARIPPGTPEAQRREYVIGFMIDLRLGARAAEAAKVGEGAEFARRLAYYRDKVLLDELMSRETKKAVTPEAARKLYDDNVKGVAPENEVRARHILVPEEAEAKAIHSRVTTGKEDFAKVANEATKDPGSKADGGDLGWFSKDKMVAVFAEAAFKLEPGQISPPVKSQFGWHVIKVEEKRNKPLPTFEEVRGEIDTYLQRKAQQDFVLALREKVKIERLDKEEPKKP